MKRFVCSLMALCFAVGVHAATIEVHKSVTQPEAPQFTIWFTGQINPRDLVQFQEKVRFIETSIKGGLLGIEATSIQLQSPGGDVRTAIEIGRIIRKNRMSTEIAGTCASSCVFLLIGGVKRAAVLGELERDIAPGALAVNRIGIHRPYFSNLSAQASEVEVKNMIMKNRSFVEEYVKEMDVSIELNSIMNSVPSNQMKWLSTDEAIRLGLLGIDATWDEKKNAEIASAYELTSGEYRAKIMAAEDFCRNTRGAGWAFSPCVGAILWNLPEPTYVLRRELASNALAAAHKKGTSLESFGRCNIDIMRGRKQTCP